MEDDDDSVGVQGLVRTSAFRHLPSFLGTSKIAPLSEDQEEEEENEDEGGEGFQRDTN